MSRILYVSLLKLPNGIISFIFSQKNNIITIINITDGWHGVNMLFLILYMRPTYMPTFMSHIPTLHLHAYIYIFIWDLPTFDVFILLMQYNNRVKKLLCAILIIISVYKQQIKLLSGSPSLSNIQERVYNFFLIIFPLYSRETILMHNILTTLFSLLPY